MHCFPSDQFTKILINKNIYSGTKTQAVLDKFKGIIQKAFNEYINDIITEKLSTLISADVKTANIPKEKNGSILTTEEIEVLDYIEKHCYANLYSEWLRTRVGKYTNSSANGKKAADSKKNGSILTTEEIEVLDFVKDILNTDLDIMYRKTSRYAYMQLGDLSTKWLCRVYIRKEQHLFVLHKFEDTSYECEYYFDNTMQLEMIRDFIIDTFEKCQKL